MLYCFGSGHLNGCNCLFSLCFDIFVPYTPLWIGGALGRFSKTLLQFSSLYTGAGHGASKHFVTAFVYSIFVGILFVAFTYSTLHLTRSCLLQCVCVCVSIQDASIYWFDVDSVFVTEVKHSFFFVVVAFPPKELLVCYKCCACWKCCTYLMTHAFPYFEM